MNLFPVVGTPSLGANISQASDISIKTKIRTALLLKDSLVYRKISGNKE
jgi:hypothetical protein